jgi:hypothetical protein
MEHNNTVKVNDSIESMRNRYNSAIVEFFADDCLDYRVGLDIDAEIGKTMLAMDFRAWKNRAHLADTSSSTTILLFLSKLRARQQLSLAVTEEVSVHLHIQTALLFNYVPNLTSP